jgi:stage V sporulation protein T
MKATGIIRRIDDLGRIVIPKKIRRNMNIREGDPMEIYLDGDNRVVFEKYNSGLLPFIHNLADLVEDNEYDTLSPESVKEIKGLLDKISKIVTEEEER